jgi:aminoglycoside phosphotransferase (APT) family kinase protein
MDPIARGRTAEILDAGEGRVLKVLRPGFPEHLIEIEASNTAAANRAGVPAPAVFGRRIVDGRRALELERVAGRPMVDEIRRAPWTAGQWGRRLVDVHSEVVAATSPDLPDVKDRLAAGIRDADLARPLRIAARDALLDLPDADNVLHGDFHPLNVMVNGERFTVIDWVDASRGSPAADVARTSWLLSRVAIPPDTTARRIVQFLGGFVRRAYLRHVPALAEPFDVARWRLPVLAARLAEGISHEEPEIVAEVKRLAG